MTDTAYSVLLFAGLLAGPASAFMVGLDLLPVYAVFPFLGLFTPARRGMLRILPLAAAPALVLLWSLLSGSDTSTERSLRWMAALVAGASMSGAIGASRASRLLHSASRRFGLFGLTESLAMAVSMAGPCARRIRDIFLESRRSGRGYTESLEAALSAEGLMETAQGDEDSARSGISVLSACLAWMLMLGGVSGVI